MSQTIAGTYKGGVISLDRLPEGVTVALRDIHDRCMIATSVRLIDLGRSAVLVTRDDEVRSAGLAPTQWD